MFDTVKRHFETGLWSLARVWNVVGRAISEEDYEKITGFVFPAKG